MRPWLLVAVSVLAACTDLGGLSGASDTPPDAGAPPPPPPPSPTDAGGDAPLACAGGLTACGSACIDTQGDAKNCGRCSHDCLGGACDAGVCAPITLATGLNDPMAIAQDVSSLYVAVYGDNAIVQVAKVAGGSNTLSTSTTAPSSIAVMLDGAGKASSIIWGEERSGGSANVITCTPPCKTVTPVGTAADEVMGIVVVGTTAYFTAYGGSGDLLRRCGLPGCVNPTNVLADVHAAYGITAVGNTLVYGRYDVNGEVARVDVSGSNPTHLFDANLPETVVSDGTNVYAALNGSSEIAKCPLTGCIGAPTTLAFAEAPHGVATDGQNVYWTNGLADGGSVAYCATSGCPGGAAMLASAQSNPYGIVVDDVAVYWVTSTPSGAVMKIAKP